MLSSRCPPQQHGCLNTASGIRQFLAFSPPPSLHTSQDDTAVPRAFSTCVGSSNNLFNPSNNSSNNPTSMHVSLRSTRLGKRPRGVASTTTYCSKIRQRLPCLRGGSAADEPEQEPTKNDHSRSMISAVSGNPMTSPPPAAATVTTSSASPAVDTSDCDRDQQQEIRSASQQSNPSTTTTADFGVALVTERSTATGGSKGLVSYSLLADGTLRVGNPERHGLTAAKEARREPPPTAAVSATAAALSSQASAVTSREEVARTTGQPRKVLLGLRRRTKDLKLGAGAVRTNWTFVQ